ncbi:hypothetical protein PRZ48_006219 [Zasmidium cellare]|uniref:BTB domain-containing protein n=1 Tax=Zasmidium cellare TaxID=395010 RepID=A0ABR0EPR7_ZASCE|nr:hypothetical protein PRZ48_006219 [Zasmidium cellare]
MAEHNDEMDTTQGAEPSMLDHTQTMPSEVKDLMQQLKSDRLIKIYIGEGIQLEPYQVSEALLTSSSDYFVKALRNEKTMGSEVGVLRFPEDGPAIEAWGSMLFWLMNKTLPLYSEENDLLTICVNGWVLGDKYLMPRYQNAIIQELIAYFKDETLPNDRDLINKLLRLSPAGSGIRQIIAEEVIFIMHGDIFPAKERIKPSELETEVKGSGIAASLLDAFTAYKGKDESEDGYLRWKGPSTTENGAASQYLVVDGVDKFEELSDSEDESDDDT